jgi:hypothetical protein
MEDGQIRAALDRHWAASDANDLEGEHQIYRGDAMLEYPQSGERIRGRRKIQKSPASLRISGYLGDNLSPPRTPDRPTPPAQSGLQSWSYLAASDKFR